MPRHERGEIKKRLAAIGRIYIETDQTEKAREELEDRLELDGECTGANLTLLLADSGVGKTHLLKSFIRDKDPAFALKEAEVDDGPVKPDGSPQTQAAILYVSLPTPCTIKSMTVEILNKLGDTLAHRTSDTASSNTDRISRLVDKRHVELMVIDEFQHLIDPDREKLLKSAAQWLKRTLDEVAIPVVCVGLPESAMILKNEAQLARRTGKLITMEPFRRDGDNMYRFRGFLNVYEQQLGFTQPSNFDDPSRAQAIYAATEGLIGRVKQLVVAAARVSMKRDEGPDAITVGDLAMAFDGLPIEGANPFDSRNYAVKSLWKSSGRSRRGRPGEAGSGASR